MKTAKRKIAGNASDASLKKRRSFNVDASTLLQLTERARQLRISENALTRLYLERGLSSSDDTIKREISELAKKMELHSTESRIKIFEAVRLMEAANKETMDRIEARFADRTERMIDGMTEVLTQIGQLPAPKKQQAPVTGRGLADQ
ncbi:TPA: hypothetical protein UL936_001903 [Stenotrophomonas maltophilia]|nr:hypothetical protein [Stenotrophomonas maltophilia]